MNLVLHSTSSRKPFAPLQLLDKIPIIFFLLQWFAPFIMYCACFIDATLQISQRYNHEELLRMCQVIMGNK